LSIVKTKDRTEIYFKDWGPKHVQPIVLHHGWPLSSDDWHAQLLFFLQHGYPVPRVCHLLPAGLNFSQ
jgi:non-heme chloroperoxidase